MKRIINKIRLLFSSLNVIGNINELVVKMHDLETMQEVNRNSIETLAMGLMDIKDKIKALESNHLSHKAIGKDVVLNINKINDLEQRTKASLKEVSLIIGEMDKNINLSNKGGK